MNLLATQGGHMTIVYVGMLLCLIFMLCSAFFHKAADEPKEPTEQELLDLRRAYERDLRRMNYVEELPDDHPDVLRLKEYIWQIDIELVSKHGH